MEGEFKNLLIVIVMVGALMSGSMMFLSGFIVSNGSRLPAGVGSALQSDSALLNSTSSAISIQVTNASSSTQTLLGGGQSPNVLSSISATFAVFGGVIVAVFGFISSIPSSFMILFNVFTNPLIDPFAAIAVMLIGIASTIIVITITFALIRAITKEDL